MINANLDHHVGTKTGISVDWAIMFSQIGSRGFVTCQLDTKNFMISHKFANSQEHADE
jgi:hypothetical protein